MITHEIIKRKPKVQVPTTTYYPTVPWQQKPRMILSAAEWKEYLDSKDWKIGELVCYDWGSVRQSDTRCCAVIMGITTDYDQLKWVNYNNRPVYLHLMGLGAYIGAHTSMEAKPYIRWSDDDKMRKLTEEEKKGLIDDNLLDYIQKATTTHFQPQQSSRP